MTAATPRRRRAAAIARGLAAGAGIVCDVLAPAAGVVFAVRFGTFVAHNTSVITAFDNCIAKVGNRSAAFSCIARPASDIWP